MTKARVLLFFLFVANSVNYRIFYHPGLKITTLKLTHTRITPELFTNSMLKTIALLVATMTTASASDSMLRGIHGNTGGNTVQKTQYTLEQRVTNLEKKWGSLHFPEHFSSEQAKVLNSVNSPWFLDKTDPNYRAFDPNVDGGISPRALERSSFVTNFGNTMRRKRRSFKTKLKIRMESKLFVFNWFMTTGYSSL